MKCAGEKGGQALRKVGRWLQRKGIATVIKNWSVSAETEASQSAEIGWSTAAGQQQLVSWRLVGQHQLVSGAAVTPVSVNRAAGRTQNSCQIPALL